MGWSLLIAELLKLFGPALTEFVKRLVEALLNRAAARMKPLTEFGSPEAGRQALFNEAINGLPRFAFGRRSLLRRMRDQDGLLTAEDREAFRDLAGAAENE